MFLHIVMALTADRERPPVCILRSDEHGEIKHTVRTMWGERENIERRMSIRPTSFTGEHQQCGWIACYSNNVLNFPRTSITTSIGRLHILSAALARQSRLFTWSARIAPLTGCPSGTLTSKGYPLTWLVIGQSSANPTLAL